MNYQYILTIIQLVCTILPSIIAAVALVKVNKIDNQDKIRRSLWAFEEYMIVLGKVIKNPNITNLENYKACYYLNSLYMDKEFRTILIKIDQYIEANNFTKVKEEIPILIENYTQTYKMKKFSPQKNIFTNHKH